MMNEAKELEKERKIISNSILNSRDEIESVLDKFLMKQNELDAKENAITEVIEYFLKILYRINRFSEFKSKFRVLKCGDTISQKELERCKLVIKMKRDKQEIRVLKNDMTGELGNFRKK